MQTHMYAYRQQYKLRQLECPPSAPGPSSSATAQTATTGPHPAATAIAQSHQYDEFQHEQLHAAATTTAAAAE